MSRSLNQVNLIGNVGSDVEVRTVGTGGRVAQLSLATSERWNDRNGQPQERTEWHRIVAWDKPFDLVSVAEKYITKGDKLYVSGSITYRQYQDKDGVTKYTSEIRAREIILLGSKDGERRESAPPQQNQRPAASGYDSFQSPDLEDDDLDGLPF